MSSAIFMDVEKAFDKIWHEGLIYSMILAKIPPQFIRFTHSSLTDRFIFFIIHGVKSQFIPILNGVPQGSPLSPLLFIIYASLIFKDKHFHELTDDNGNNKATMKGTNIYQSQFADDIKIYGKSTSTIKLHSELQSATDKVIDKCNELKIKIDGSKTSQLNFGRNNKTKLKFAEFFK